MLKAIVLLSGGLDSATCLGFALNNTNYSKEDVITVSVYYGQKHSKELECARKLSEYYDVKHYEMDLSNIFSYSNCPLLKDSDEVIPDKSYAEQIAENGEGKVVTYVPFRNGLMLSALASFAQSLFPNDPAVIMIGAHADDAAGDAYADCSFDFIQNMNQAIKIGTYGMVQVYAPFVNFTKKDIVKMGLDLNVPYSLTWSCYCGEEKQCGKCGTCIDRKAAFEANGATDPVPYATDEEVDE